MAKSLFKLYVENDIKYQQMISMQENRVFGKRWFLGRRFREIEKALENRAG